MELGRIGEGSGFKLNIFIVYFFCLFLKWYFFYVFINIKR